MEEFKLDEFVLERKVLRWGEYMKLYAPPQALILEEYLMPRKYPTGTLRLRHVEGELARVSPEQIPFLQEVRKSIAGTERLKTFILSANRLIALIWNSREIKLVLTSLEGGYDEKEDRLIMRDTPF